MFAQPVAVTGFLLICVYYTANQSQPGAAISLVYSSLSLCQRTLMENIVIRYKLISYKDSHINSVMKLVEGLQLCIFSTNSSSRSTQVF